MIKFVNEDGMNKNLIIMAYTQEGMLGKFSGRLGELVVYQMNGKVVMRTKPGKRTKPAQGRQKVTQNNFARVMGIIQPMKSYLKMGFNDLAGGKFVFHKANSENLKRFYKADKPDDLRWLLLSKGERAGALGLSLEMGAKQVTVRWGGPEPEKPASGEDRVMLLALNTSTLEPSFNTNAGKRREAQATLALPHAKAGEEILVFISFFDLAGSIIKRDPENISTSQLVG